MKRIFFVAALAAPFFSTPARAFDGCLGVQVKACLEAVRPNLKEIDYQGALRSIDKYLAGDITGKRKPTGILSLSYHSKFSDSLAPPQLITLRYASALAITEIEVTLRDGAMAAESEAEYQATHMYETALFALGSHDNCRELAKAHDFYLFFHQSIKPKLKLKLKQQKAERKAGEFKPSSELLSQTSWIGMCGKQIQLTFSSQAWGSAQADMERKFNATLAHLNFR
jgi:hypothetical protein